MSMYTLVGEVKKHPLLYDKDHINYNNVPLKQAVWRKISEKINFDGNADKCKAKWKHVRDQFIRHIKTSVNNGTPISRRFEHIHFLIPHLQIAGEPSPIESLENFSEVKSENNSNTDPEEDADIDITNEIPLSLDLDLIAEVYKHPIMYDTNHPNHKNLTTRNKVWIDISQALGTKSPDQCKKSWYRARTSYARLIANRNKRGPGFARKHSQYDKHLHFLIPFLTHKKRNCGISENETANMVVEDRNGKEENNKNDGDNFDLAAFCREIQKYPALYDIKNELYSDYYHKNAMWKTMSKTLNVEDIVLKGKWLDLKSKWTGVIKQRQQRINYSSKYDKHLSWLTPYIVFELKNSQAIENKKNDDSEYDDCYIQVHQALNSDEAKEDAKTAINSSILNMILTLPKKDDAKKCMVETNEEHPVDVFLKSISETLKHLDPDCWAAGKSKILEVIHEIEKVHNEHKKERCTSTAPVSEIKPDENISEYLESMCQDTEELEKIIGD